MTVWEMIVAVVVFTPIVAVMLWAGICHEQADRMLYETCRAIFTAFGLL